MKDLLFFIFIFLISVQAIKSQSEFLACDTVFKYRGANYKMGIVDYQGNIVLEPIFRTMTDFELDRYYKTSIFSKEDMSYGIIDSKGEILIEGLERIDDFKANESGTSIYFSHGYEDITLYSVYQRKKIGFFKNAYAMGFNDYGNVGIQVRKSSEKYCFNKYGDACDSKTKRSRKFCKTSYSMPYIEGLEDIRSSEANVASYQEHFPEYVVHLEFYNQDGSISLMVSKNRKFGLIDNQGKILAELKYDSMRFEEGLIRLSISYGEGLMQVDGKVILECKYNYIKFNDPEENWLLVGTKQQCEGYADLTGRVYLPEDCQ